MKRSYYFLVAGEILFHTPDGEMGQVRLNAVVMNDSDTVPSALIGKAQQVLQLNFFKMANDAENTVVNVIILNFTNLGRMTEEQFHAVPEGMKIQEVPAELAEVVAAINEPADPFAASPINFNKNSPNGTVN